MGKESKLIVLYSDDDDDDSDSLSLIAPVTDLSLEHIPKKISCEDIDDQSKKFEKLGLNDSNKKEGKTHKIIKQSRHHPYRHSSKSKKDCHRNLNVKRIDNHRSSQMTFLKSLGYIQYSSSKVNTKRLNDVDQIRSLYIQVNKAINETFSKLIDQPKKVIIFVIVVFINNYESFSC